MLFKEFSGKKQVDVFIEKLNECCKNTDWSEDAPSVSFL
jgi:hypothetical protein